MLSFFRRKKNRPLGLVLVYSQQISQALARKLASLVKELKLAGVNECYFVDVYAKGHRQTDGVDWVNSEHLSALVSGRPILLLSEHGYCLSSEWMTQLLSESDRVRNCVITADNDGYSSQLMLSFEGLALPASLSNMHRRTIIASIAACGSIGELISKLPCQPSKMQLTPGNIASLYRQAAAVSVPITYQVETSNRCNYKCLMCHYHGERQRDMPTFIDPCCESDMPLERFKWIVDQIYELAVEYETLPVTTIIPYGRGELLLYPHWKEALAYVKSKGFKAYFSSNGSLWTKEDVDFIIDVGLDNLQLSIEGTNVASHELIRLNQEFAHTVNALKMILKARDTKNKTVPQVTLAHTLNERNFTAYQEYVDYWIDKVDALFLGPENYTEPDNWNKKYKSEFSPVSPPSLDHRLPCNMLKDCAWFYADGTAMLCIGHKKYGIGNVFESTVREVLFSLERQKIIDSHSRGFYGNHICVNCDHWYCAHYEVEQFDRYLLRKSVDTQFYDRKTELMKWWNHE